MPVPRPINPGTCRCSVLSDSARVIFASWRKSPALCPFAELRISRCEGTMHLAPAPDIGLCQRRVRNGNLLKRTNSHTARSNYVCRANPSDRFVIDAGVLATTDNKV